MNIPDGSRNAVQVALQTLKDRCCEYQYEIRRLEEENLALRLKCESTNENNLDSLTEIDRLNARIMELNDQNNQHLRNNTMITTENRKLWSKLSTLCIANKTMGDHITKVNNYINEPYSQSNTALIRSRTFTHDVAPAKYAVKAQSGDEHSLDFEEVSLKIGECNNVDNVTFDSPAILEHMINSSLAFDFHNRSNNHSTIEYFENNLTDLKLFKEIIVQQNYILKNEVKNLGDCKIDYKCGNCSINYHKDAEKEAKIVDTRQYHAQQTEDATKLVKKNLSHSNDIPPDMSRELDSLACWGTPENSNHFLNTAEKDIVNSMYDVNDQICPICTETFAVSISFDVFRKHVEDHFLELP